MTDVDNRRRRASFVAVNRFRTKLVAAFLLAFWLAATQHCGLETLGLFSVHGEASSNCCAGTDDRARDGCGTVEDGNYRLDAGTLKVASPQLSVCVPLICSIVAAPTPDVLPGMASCHRLERPLDWVSTWQFVQRAALSPRAPSMV